MKLSDILLSVMFHAGIVAGVMYGLTHYDEEALDEAEMTPIFFEILEESVMASDKQSEATNLQSEKESDDAKDEIRTEFTGVNVAAEAIIQQISESSTEYIETAEEKEVQKEDGLKVRLEEPAKMEPTEPENVPDVLEKAETETHEGESVQSSEIQLAKVVSEPMALNRIVPTYPRSARRRGREGVVTIEIVVSGSGAVTKVDVIGSSGHSDLDSAAVSAVKTAHFAPATEDGIQVEGRLRLTFEFKLK